MGHNPPPPPPTALHRLRVAYVTGAVDLETFEERVAWLLERGQEGRRTLVEYEVPEPGGLPPAARVDPRDKIEIRSNWLS